MDRKIIEQLYRNYGRELTLYLFSLCRSREMAEDLLHETFVKAMLSLQEGHTNMRAWLYTVARNLCINGMKRRNREVPRERYGEEQTDFDGGLGKLLVKEQNQALYNAIAQLPERQREVILMQYFGRMSLKTISVVMGITSENARILSYRAKKQLRIIMKEDGYDLP